MVQNAFGAGSGQLIVVYSPEDTGNEIDPDAVFAEIASDAAQRRTEGWRLASIAVMPLRHSGVLVGVDGSGYETRLSVAVAYTQV